MAFYNWRTVRKADKEKLPGYHEDALMEGLKRGMVPCQGCGVFYPNEWRRCVVPECQRQRVENTRRGMDLRLSIAPNI